MRNKAFVYQGTTINLRINSKAEFTFLDFCCQTQLLSVIAILINFSCLIDEGPSFFSLRFPESIYMSDGVFKPLALPAGIVAGGVVFL